MKLGKRSKTRIFLVVLLVALAGAVFYLVTIKNLFAPVEVKYKNEKPTISFTNIEAYTPYGNEGFTVYAKTESWYNGTCTFVFSKQDVGIRLEETFAIDKKTGCHINKPFSYFGTDGQWNVFILLKNSNGDFATESLEGIEVDSNYKPKQLTFKSVKSSYKKNNDGVGVHRFVAQLSGNATGKCYFLFLPESGRGAVSKYIKVEDSNKCVYEVLSTEFSTKEKGWQRLSINFEEPYNRYDVKAHESREFVYY